MKKKGYLRIGQKNLVVVLITLVLVISSLITACGSSTTETTSGVTEEVADKVEEKTVEEVTQVETVVEEVESTKEVETFQSVKEWAKSVERTEPKMTIWNEGTKEGIILDNEQKYVLKEGDLLVFCTKEMNSGMSIHADLSLEDFKSSGSDNYVKFKFNKVFSEETLFKVEITVAGTEYTFSVTLISEGVEDKGVETNGEENLIGRDWAATLEYDEPKLIVWNDETNTKEVIDNGGSYQMQSGDMLGIYHSEKYFPVRTDPIEFCEGFNAGLPYSMMICNLPEESQTINLGLELLDMESENFVTYYFTITTP